MSSNFARRVLALLTVFAAAFVAAIALTTSVPRDFAFVSGGDRLDIFFDSAASAATLGSIVAVVAALSLTRTRWALVAMGCGILLLGVMAVLTVSWVLHPRAFAAGLILGGAAALTSSDGRRTAQCSLISGVLSGAMLADLIVSGPIRYRDYLASTAPQSYFWIAVGVLAVLLVASVGVSAFGQVRMASNRLRMLLVGIVIPLVGLVLYWSFDRALSSLGSGGVMQNRWVIGIFVIPLLVGAALALPAATGSVLLAALAFISAAGAGTFGWSSAIMFVALVLVGFGIGLWRRMPLAAFGILAVVAATGIFTAPPLDVITTVATAVVLPVAVGVAFASLLPTEAPVAAMAATTPIVVTVPIVVEFGWTAYTPLTSIEPSYSPSTWVWTSTGVSVLSVVAAVVGLILLRRRELGVLSSE
ncbi:hypothetical protein [Rhodococcoides kyotonense]|uniref:hypothetical protein n=1 Tax=Rhodococcoides kyotonense TaxID=398843 RepID=UPI001FE3FD84|nr:hypothetical protein [Rhodococcus kyotonensis]